MENIQENLISLCKRRGFIYQGSEIYGGFAGFFDFGPLGVRLKHNVKQLWKKRFVYGREDMHELDASILMRQEVWQASGHVEGFSDPLVECTKCGKRFRADQLYEEKHPGESWKEQSDFIKSLSSLDGLGRTNDLFAVCKNCGAKRSFSEPRDFNMMFETRVGAIAKDDPTSISYLRPETAQGIFANYKNVLDSMHPKIPFGIAQIGKAFRNEIAPRDFIFRLRELEQMEIEYFISPNEWEKQFEHFRIEMNKWVTEDLGLKLESVREYEVPDGDRAHYSKRTIDFEFNYSFGFKELYGLAYRTDYDLSKHAEKSGVDLSYFNEETKERFIPHVIEPSFGVERTILAILTDAYTEDELGGEKRVYLKLSPNVAPYKIAIFPLLKNKPELVSRARKIYEELKAKGHPVVFDDNGNIGKRYRRQDEIGTPYCVTIDFDTLEKSYGEGMVTVRNRDTGEQERIQENLIAVKYL